ncbi:hypothetical protein C8R45DRAFT_1219713 [Mycena sanguinolenta]|nr:hypothetical protein C8R45DRAFT_1219713 [Mycena sanguinolenta]
MVMSVRSKRHLIAASTGQAQPPCLSSAPVMLHSSFANDSKSLGPEKQETIEKTHATGRSPRTWVRMMGERERRLGYGYISLYLAESSAASLAVDRSQLHRCRRLGLSGVIPAPAVGHDSSLPSSCVDCCCRFISVAYDADAVHWRTQ